MNIIFKDLNSSLVASSPAESQIDQLRKDLNEAETDKVDLSYQVDIQFQHCYPLGEIPVFLLVPSFQYYVLNYNIIIVYLWSF